MRITTGIIMFYLWLTGAANLLESTGISAAMGLSTSYSAGAKLEEAVDALGSISGGGLAVEELIGIFVLLARAVEAFAAGLTAGPRLMAAMGIPTAIVVFIHIPVALFAARLGIYALSGREL